MNRKLKSRIIIASFLATVIAVSVAVSCQFAPENPVPKPNGYFRIDPYAAEYESFGKTPLDIRINKSATARITNTASTKDGSIWFDVTYPKYNATIYCSYVPVTPATLQKHLQNRMLRVYDNTQYGKPVCITFEDSVHRISSHMFMASEKNVTPLQFISTDSTSFVYTGTLFMNGIIRPDSIAPVVDYITDDVVYMLQHLKNEKR